MPISTEMIFASAERYATVNKIALDKVYKKLNKEGKLPPLKESQITTQYKAEDIAYKVLQIMLDDGITTYQELEEQHHQAQKAYFLCPINIVVLNSLIITALNDNDTQRWLAKGIKLAESIFDDAYEAENKGHYWGLNATRPYIRMLETKFNCLVENGKKKEAITIAERIIYLNESDNLGVRDDLQLMYLKEKMYEEYIVLIDKYPNDYSVGFYFNYALYLYLIEGPNHPDTTAAMEEAIAFNPFVLDYITKKKNPIKLTSKYYNPQKVEGAILYYETSKHLWLTVFGVQKWLAKFV